MSKYISLPLYKAFFPVSVDGSGDDTLLQDSIEWAEGEFERMAGSQFNQQSLVNEQPQRAWVDRNNIVTLIAKTVGPVTAVTSVQYLIPRVTAWQTVTWDSANGIFVPSTDAPPRPEAWVVEIVPTSIMMQQVAADNIRFRWSYTGGYATTPTQLQMILFRMAFWKYKLREAPLGKVAVPPMAITEVIPDLPTDIKTDINLWRRQAF